MQIFRESNIGDSYGVNQGGNASWVSFWQYTADLVDYLIKQNGLRITDDIIVHFLWADDLVSILLFETLIRPVLLYGSDAISSWNNDAINKELYQFSRSPSSQRNGE